MLRKLVGKALALLALVGFLATADVADAAAGGKVQGTVVNARNGRGVNHARVRLAAAKHHHKHKKHKKGKKGLKGKHKVHAAHAAHHGAKHAGVLTGSNGHFAFNNVGSGMVTVIAHKRGVGSGRAHVAAGSGAFSITLHKRHHGHSGVVKHAAKLKHKKLGRRKPGAKNALKKPAVTN